MTSTALKYVQRFSSNCQGAGRIPPRRALRNIAALLCAVLDEESTDLCIIDEDGTVVLASPDASGPGRAPAEEAIGAKIDTLLPETVAADYLTKVSEVFRTGGAATFEENRQGLHLRHTLLPLKEETRVTHVAAICRDMTAERRLDVMKTSLQQRLVKKTAELEEAVKEHESFSYSVSHDLRAPLRHINCYAAILEETLGTTIPAEAAQCVDRIKAATQRMGSLIDSLLRLSRISRAPFARQSVDLSDVAATVAHTLCENDEERSVELVVQAGVTSRCDPVLVRQLMRHLIDNARKYTSGRSDARIEFGTDKCGATDTFFVKDNGAGFDMAYSNKLFKAFERLHGDEFEGGGVGLAAARKIVSRHGGRIWAEGKPGEGSTFYFTLSPEWEEGS